MGSGKTIGVAELSNGLYIFKDGLDKDIQKSAHQISRINDCSDDVYLWHYRLGHPSFMYLSHLFPTLFRNNLSQFYKYEVCE